MLCLAPATVIYAAFYAAFVPSLRKIIRAELGGPLTNARYWFFVLPADPHILTAAPVPSPTYTTFPPRILHTNAWNSSLMASPPSTPPQTLTLCLPGHIGVSSTAPHPQLCTSTRGRTAAGKGVGWQVGPVTVPPPLSFATSHATVVAQCEELEVLLDRALKEKSLPWFSALTMPTPADNPAPPLSTSKKPHRDLTLANNTLTKVHAKAGAFLSMLGRRQREVELFAIIEVGWRWLLQCTVLLQRLTSFSGAGKAESPKYIVRYMTSAKPNTVHETTSSKSVEHQVLATNPILVELPWSGFSFCWLRLRFTPQSSPTFAWAVLIKLWENASHPQCLECIYFNVALLLRAIHCTPPHLEQYDYYLGTSESGVEEMKCSLERVVDVAQQVGKFDKSLKLSNGFSESLGAATWFWGFRRCGWRRSLRKMRVLEVKVLPSTRDPEYRSGTVSEESKVVHMTQLTNLEMART
ncbi:hypothetical protein BT96DRAFT_999043 [Gymnopus androsaceus JB14]|uniref:Uncharacterized protein n=1 Tax=Gymnopus androsaceus JB14 TaxID=1447944 RepID=A0A6A4H949_9AGAR|nr:hypothetical protein BT96DRAFT_999043 [Gymnopus androsaceus JB14]